MRKEKPEIFYDDDQFLAALEDGRLPKNIEELVNKAGGIVPYTVLQVTQAIAELKIKDLEIVKEEFEPNRGSGAGQSILVKQGDKEVTKFLLNIGRNDFGDVLVGVIMYNDAAVKQQIQEATRQ